jgi:hypothetical protein
MDELIPQLRRLQHAANMLSGHQFAEALGWDWDDYAKAKYLEFRALGRLGVFDDQVLTSLVHAYEQVDHP